MIQARGGGLCPAPACLFFYALSVLNGLRRWYLHAFRFWGGRFQQTKQIAVGGKNHGRVITKSLPIHVERFYKTVKLSGRRARVVSIGVNLRSGGIRLALDFFNFSIGLRLYFEKIFLAAAVDLGSFASTF